MSAARGSRRSRAGAHAFDIPAGIWLILAASAMPFSSFPEFGTIFATTCSAPSGGNRIDGDYVLRRRQRGR